MASKSLPPITLRFRRWAGPVGQEAIFFRELFGRATGRDVTIVDDPNINVDIQIESVYGEGEPPKLQSRALRFVQSHLPGGIRFDDPRFSTNQQPTGDARFRIFFTGENERPPQGRWDAYLSFDVHSYEGRNSYLPLWWITSSDILVPTVSPYLGRAITLEQMMTPRRPSFQDREKFCVAFIGKAYPFRMQSIAALSKIGKVDVYGAIARNTRQTRAEEKFEIAQQYKFVYAFENDHFPGYVTEKLPEAWATGAVPLYWGFDVTKSMNPSAFINAADFPTLEDFVEYVGAVASSESEWSNIASQPLLIQKPTIENVIRNLERILYPLREIS
jgi:hypothetical protein